MPVPSKFTFELINKIIPADVKNSKYKIYAHSCPKGVYVGMAADPAERWKQHLLDAKNENSGSYTDDFKDAIRTFGARFKHYIVAVSDFEKAAKNKEAAAIEFYSDKLNMKREVITGGRNYNFRPIGSEISQKITLSANNERVSVSRGDTERKPVIAEICFEKGRKRLRSISGQNFPAGLYVTCSKAERSRFNVGDRVRVNVALSEDSKYLVAASTASLQPV